MSLDGSFGKPGEDQEKINSVIRSEVEDLIAKLWEEHSLFYKILYFPHIVTSRAMAHKSNQEITLAPLRSSMMKLKRLQMCLPGCCLAWVVLCLSHLFTSLWVEGRESIGLMILSFVMVGVMGIIICLSLFNEKTSKSSAVNTLLLMSIMFVFATLISRLISISEISILFKIGILRIVMLSPVLVFEHPIASVAFTLTGDVGIALMLGLSTSSQDDVTKSAFMQNIFGLISYIVVFSLHLLLSYARSRIRATISEVLEKLCEISLIQVSVVSHLQGIPNYLLRLEKVDPLANNMVSPVVTAQPPPLSSSREDQRLLTLRRVTTTRIKMMSISSQHRMHNTPQNTSRNYGSIRVTTTAFTAKEPAKTGFKLTTNPESRNLLDNFEDILRNIFFTSASRFGVDRILTDQKVNRPEFDEVVDKFKEFLRVNIEHNPFYPVEEFWAELGDKVLSKYDCLVKLEHLSHKNLLESNYVTKTLLIYSVGKRSEASRSLYIKIRKEIGYQVHMGPSPHKSSLRGERSGDKLERHVSGISAIVPVLKMGNTLGGRSVISVRPINSRISAVGEENNLSPLVDADWPDYDGDEDGQPSSIIRPKPDGRKFTSIDSQAQSSHFSRAVHFIESSTSKKEQDIKSKFNFSEEKSVITSKNILVSSPPDRSASRNFQQNQMTDHKLNLQPVTNLTTSSPAQTQSMEELISMVVHDMRSPLMCIQGNLELIVLELKDKPIFEPLEPLIKASIAASTLLETLVSDVLDSARISKGIFKITAEQMGLEETIMECIETLRIAANSRENILSCEFNSAAKTIVSDKQRIKQVLLNFLSNSIKFTSQGRINIKVCDTLDTVRISIEDNGRGISKENIPKLFEKFSSDRSSRSNAKGIGLGLFICKSIIETLGPKKDIIVTSEPKVKTTITFEIFKNVKKGSMNTLTIGRNTIDATRTRLKSETISVQTPRALHRGRRKSFDIFDINNQGIFETKSIIEVKRRTIIRHRDKELSRLSPSSSIVIQNPSVLYPEDRILRDEESVLKNYPSHQIVKNPTLPSQFSASFGPVVLGEDEVNEREEESGREDPGTKKNQQSTQLLILDDEPSVSELLKLFTEQLSKQEDTRIEVTEAECIEEADSLVARRKFDIIVTDYNLPDGLGPDFIRQIKEKCTAEGSRPPLTILITGEDPHCQEITKISHLYREVLKKPVGMAMWSKTLKKLLQELPAFPASLNSNESLD